MMASFARAQTNHIPLDTKGTELENEMADKGIHYYKVKIGDDYDGKSDLIVTIRAKDDKSDPDLHISSQNQSPTGMGSSEFSCAMVGEDICTIPSSSLSKGKTFYIGAKCYRNCSYKINANLLSELELFARKDYKVPVQAGEQKIFTFTNPHPGVKNIIFTARAEKRTTSMRMYAKQGADSAPTTSDYSSTDGWEDGIVIKLSQSTTVRVKDDEVYKILFESDDSTNVTFRIDLVYSEKLIEEGKIYDDFVNYNEKTCYKYIVKTTDKNLRIGAYSFSGNPDIYVNPGSNPAGLDSYAFKATEPSDDVLVLTPDDREEKGAKKGAYYICIYGKSNTSYRFRVAESNDDYFLEDGIAETNEVKSGKEINFFYTDSALKRDLNLTFTMSVKSGPTPNMYIKSCGRVSESECYIGDKKASEVTKAIGGVGTVYSVISHSGNQCKTAAGQGAPCIYVIVVESPKSDSNDAVTHFSLVAQHNETSHIKMREGISIEQIVENKQVRYFEFVVRDSSATKVVFTLNSHHGDADIYVSTLVKYPDQKNNQKKSARSKRFADEVMFEREDDKSLLGVYYIAVQGYGYSSYSIRASIERGSEEKKVLPIQITEGIPLNEIMYSQNDKKYYQFKTSMYGTSISDIKISLTQIAGKFNFYVKNGELPSEEDYDFKSEDGSDIDLKSKSKKFEAVGTKYILVVPSSNYGSSASSWRYSIKYTTVRSISVVRDDVPSFGTVQVGNINYYKYQNVDKGASLTLSLTSLSGDANMVVSADPALSYPTLVANDYHSKELGIDSIVISGDKLSKKNPSCKVSETALLGSKPCEIYIGVYCNDNSGASQSRTKDLCSYSIKVYTDEGNDGHMLIDGLPQKDKVQEAKSLYYFMDVEEDRDYLYIAAIAKKGHIKIYVSFIDQGDQIDESVLPSKRSHTQKSKEIGHSETIHFTKKDIKKHCSDFRSCVALIGVEGKGIESEYNEFSLVAYTQIPRLMENTPMVTPIKEKAMTYYTYKTYCTDCTIIISAIAYSIDADVDLFINFGHKKNLPTNDDYDIKSQTWFNEHIEIDLNHKYMKDNGVRSMKDTFIIGVYSKEDATVSIEVEETVSRIKKISKGKSVKVDHDPNEIRFFEFEHTGENSLKFELTGVTGAVNMRINKYQVYDNIDPQHKFLPKDENTSIWSTHSKQNATIKISTEDYDFCSNCIYLIGIESHLSGAKYMIEVEEEFVQSTKQIRLGVPIKDQVAHGDYKQYMFVLDKVSKFRVACSVYLGTVEYSVATDKDFDDVVATSNKGDIVIDKDIDEFERGENVYIRVHGKFDYSEFILIVSHNDSYSIIPDSYTQEFTVNPFDLEGYHFIYYPPSTQFNLFMQVNSLSDGMQYEFFATKKYVKDLKMDLFVFPDQSDDIFKNIYFWDHNRNYFSGNLVENPERDDEFIYLITIRPKVLNEGSLIDKENVKFTVNLNSHDVNILSPNLQFEDTFAPTIDNWKFYKFYAQGNKDIEIILTPCICDTDIYLFRSLEDAYSGSNPIDRTRHYINGQKKLFIPNANGPFFVKSQLTSDNQDREIMDNTNYCAYQIMFVDRAHPNYLYSTEKYVAENDGVVDYFWPNYRRIRFKWGNILEETPSGNKVHPTIADVWLIKNPSLYMNSVCGMKHAEARGQAELIERGNTENGWKFNPRHNKFTKNGNYATFTVLATVNKVGAAVPFRPVRLWVGIPWWRTIPWIYYILFFIIIGGLGYSAYHYKKKAISTQKKLDFEMNDIRNVARVGYADDSVEHQNLHKDDSDV